MSAIVGIAGLQPTLDIIKISKTVVIANKESIICGWHIISKLIKKYKTKVLPVDSEHYSIMELTNNTSDEEIEEIIITASGGPFLNLPKKKLLSVKPEQAIKHPKVRQAIKNTEASQSIKSPKVGQAMKSPEVSQIINL